MENALQRQFCHSVSYKERCKVITTKCTLNNRMIGIIAWKWMAILKWSQHCKPLRQNISVFVLCVQSLENVFSQHFRCHHPPSVHHLEPSQRAGRLQDTEEWYPASALFCRDRNTRGTRNNFYEVRKETHLVFQKSLSLKIFLHLGLICLGWLQHP